MEYVVIGAVLFFFLGIPVILTGINIAMLFFRERPETIPLRNILDLTIFLLGIVFTVLYVGAIGFVDWNTPLYGTEKFTWMDGTYTPIAFDHLPTILVLSLAALAGYVWPRIAGTRMPPLIAAGCYAGMFIGFALFAMLVVQLWVDILRPDTWLLLLFPLNYVLCCIRLIRTTVGEYSRKLSEADYHNPILRFSCRLLSRSAGFVLGAFVLVIPLLLAALPILLLFGQQPDSIVKAFTETAEWTLSQKIPPPRLDYEGHYLCTVAACGDEKTVKPMRAGRRHGRLIVVNRQLLVANAFEDLIAERSPRFHRFVRGIYDKYGLPISWHITTKRRSNAVYYLMKPLEWVFVLCLYTFDLQPENRIARQYTGT